MSHFTLVRDSAHSYSMYYGGRFLGMRRFQNLADTDAEFSAAGLDPTRYAISFGWEPLPPSPVDTFIELPILGVNYCAFDTRDLFYVRKGHDVDIALYFRGIDYAAKGTYPQFVTFADKSERDAAYTRIVAAMKASRTQ